MWPWGHAVVGYLLYTAYTRYRYDRPPAEVPTILLLGGTQFPDLIDKPLAWSLTVLPSGRTLGHSLLILVPLSILVYLLAIQHRKPDWGGAFVIGALSHAIVDVLPAAIRGEYAYTTSLLWPLLPAPPYDEHNRTIVGHFLTIEPSFLVMFEVVLVLVVLAIWWHDDQPGAATFQRLLN